MVAISLIYLCCFVFYLLSGFFFHGEPKKAGFPSKFVELSPVDQQGNLDMWRENQIIVCFRQLAVSRFH